MIWLAALAIVLGTVAALLLIGLIIASVLHVQHEREWAKSSAEDRAAAIAAWELVSTK